MISERLSEALHGTRALPEQWRAFIITLMSERKPDLRHKARDTIFQILKNHPDSINVMITSQYVQAAILAKPEEGYLLLDMITSRCVKLGPNGAEGKNPRTSRDTRFIQGSLRGSLEAALEFDREEIRSPRFDESLVELWAQTIFSFVDDEPITDALDGGFDNALSQYLKVVEHHEKTIRDARINLLIDLLARFERFQNDSLSLPDGTVVILNKFFHKIFNLIWCSQQHFLLKQGLTAMLKRGNPKT